MHNIIYKYYFWMGRKPMISLKNQLNILHHPCTYAYIGCGINLKIMLSTFVLAFFSRRPTCKTENRILIFIKHKQYH